MKDTPRQTACGHDEELDGGGLKSLEAEIYNDSILWNIFNEGIHHNRPENLTLSLMVKALHEDRRRLASRLAEALAYSKY